MFTVICFEVYDFHKCKQIKAIYRYTFDIYIHTHVYKCECGGGSMNIYVYVGLSFPEEREMINKRLFLYHFSWDEYFLS